MDEQAILSSLVSHALLLGVSDAKIFDPGLIAVDDKFPGFCREPRCPGFGQSMSCPPNVEGPDWFRACLERADHVLVFKFDVPSTTLLSDDRHDVTRLIHDTASAIERFAVGKGYKQSAGFAGGSCRQLFCAEHDACRVLAKQGECRHPEIARPSMSGMGVDVLKLTRLAGWKNRFFTTKDGPANSDSPDDAVSMGFMAGLVLLER
ncbi:MAG: DUF2284 domain-containing protein [Desulfobacteraceae bacterium]